MRRIRIPLGCLLLAPGLFLTTGALGQTTYTDALGDNYGDTSADISNVVVSNDASNVYFTVNLNPAANLTPAGSNDYYADYEVGIQSVPTAGGQTAINTTYGTGNPAAGNPYGSDVGISSGENYFIGSYLDGSSYSGGAQLYSYNSATGWSQVGATAPITEIYTGTPSTSFAFPLSALGLSAGSQFKFDVWTTYSGGQGAYDALDNNGEGPGPAPYSGGSYDSATVPGSVLATYTVTSVPEPASMAMLAGAGLMMLRRRRA